MGQVTITLNGRAFRLSCGEGEESRLKELSSFVLAKVEKLTTELGQIGDERLLLMAAVLIADELFELRERRAEACEPRRTPRRPRTPRSAEGVEQTAAEPVVAMPLPAAASP